MTTMASEGFLVQDVSNKAYSVGPQVFAVASAYEPRVFLERVAHSTMSELALACGQTCALGIASGDQLMYVTVVDNPRATTLHITVRPGRRRPYHSSAVGKMLLANMSDEDAARILHGSPLVKLTPFTIDSVDALRAELDEIQRTGVAFSNQESVLGIGAIAAGIRNAKGSMIAGINVVFPFHLVNTEERDRIVRLALDAAQEISERVGCLAL
jgi:DNA-binding IclR family transcriptional regulator